MSAARDALRHMIEADGPLTIADYMAFCLTDPQHGYYMRRDPFGQKGDFTTAPEISQMFGELVGLWAASVWLESGSTQPLCIAELGPGRGTLMADALRAIAQVPVLNTVPPSVHLVEASPFLRKHQGKSLAKTSAEIHWHDDIASLPDTPMIVIANEFFDALPIRQAMKVESGWHERCVGLDDKGELIFGLAPHALNMALPPWLELSELGDTFEWRDRRAIEEIAQLIASRGGAMLAIDYGHRRSGYGDTLQAVQKHTFVNALASPGDADITAHVDFEALARAAVRKGASVFGAIEQGTFLERLGITQRAERLQKTAPKSAAAVAAALSRLTGRGEGQMGGLFKVMALAGPTAVALPGFEPADRFEG
ncbi:hypothetical protein GJW-30_1_01758 [Variibacter gotjawalensis]|uniref:S-adenosyl-L-methionine-dependent methyltransferase n=1 Tax=Variibacter gotjawalensis TaxID=1333996 RepID=A0A0S3PTI0_9BRAD|nr:SAM-dependent methyltransferase [Variibacter gotjawalensis]NIK49543.1 SAM-dependent MidA family methyltransferase [Variibacter gotjawalensis]RZS51394.1 SAM-dependent MidA family methyltransferase [Variibacter gotjawalensis]BAT59227.1 hypothetical protein GJW-30_1_01758 [Variibacter gotjawalensis]